MNVKSMMQLNMRQNSKQAHIKIAAKNVKTMCILFKGKSLKNKQ